MQHILYVHTTVKRRDCKVYIYEILYKLITELAEREKDSFDFGQLAVKRFNKDRSESKKNYF